MSYVNKGLYKLHHVFFFSYLILILFGVLASVFVMNNSGAADFSSSYLQVAVFFCLLPSIPCAIHYFAATGVKTGKKRGRVLSRLMAWLMILVFPVGTAISIYMFRKTGTQWQQR